MKFPTEWKFIKAMFQTTNQLYDATNLIKGIDKWLIYDGQLDCHVSP